MTTYRIVDLPGGGQAEVSDETLAYDIPDGTVTLHRNKMQSRTIEFWKTKAVFCALRDIVGDEIQEIENATWDVLASKDIDRAFGASLDLIGRIVGQAREGLTDPQYRVALRARERINRSQGTTNDVLAMLELVDSAGFTITDTPPAAFIVVAGAPLSGFATNTEIADLLAECRAAGIGARIILMTASPAFAMGDSIGGTVPNLDLGDSIGTSVARPFLPDGRAA